LHNCNYAVPGNIHAHPNGRSLENLRGWEVSKAKTLQRVLSQRGSSLEGVGWVGWGVGFSSRKIISWQENGCFLEHNRKKWVQY